MPNEPALSIADFGLRSAGSAPAQSAIRNRHSAIKHTAYPCRERGGVVWAYLGSRSEAPELPRLEWLSLPEERVRASKIMRDCNWVQALEGDIDSSHTSFLHASLRREDAQEGYSRYKHQDRAPRLEVVVTDYGVMYGARRAADEESSYWRIAQFLMPFYTMIPPIGPRVGVGTRIWVPLDDKHTMYWQVAGAQIGPSDAGDRPRGGNGAPTAGEYLPGSSDWLGRWRLAANRANDYFIDREMQRAENYTGVSGTNLQDQMITESMGPIVDRAGEHLGAADAMIVQTRRRLIEAAVALRDHGTPPPGVDDPDLYWVRPASVVLPRDVDWLEGAQEHLVARPGVPVASV